MDDGECTKMLDHLQQYVPHLEKLITQLKDPKKKNRELQLSKLEGLHSMITDRKKKLRLDTLKKCEDVILKILQKVHPNIHTKLQQQPSTGMTSTTTKSSFKTPPAESAEQNDQKTLNSIRLKEARARLNELSVTPASPSPPRELPPAHKPIVIPTEKVRQKVPNPDEFHIGNWEKTFEQERNDRPTETYKTEKPDVYRKAAESLTLSNASISNKKVFDRLGERVDMSKPPLSAEDLEELVEPEREIYFDGSDDLSVGELEDLRHLLQKKLKQNDAKKDMTDLRDKLNKDKGKNKEDKQHKQKSTVKPSSSSSPSSSSATSATSLTTTAQQKNSKVERVFNDAQSKFGSLLSSIDNQILGDGATVVTTTKKKDKTESDKSSKSDKDRKSSKDKERRSDQKDEKKMKDHRNKDKKHSTSGSKEKEYKTDSSEKSKTEKQKSEITDKPKPARSETSSSSVSKHRSDKKPQEKRDRSVENKLKQATSEPKKLTEDVPKVEKEPAPVFKRLADKYNRKPRKPSTVTTEKLIDDLPSQPIQDQSQPLGMFNQSALNVSAIKPSSTPAWFEAQSPIFDSPSSNNDNSNLMGPPLPVNPKRALMGPGPGPGPSYPTIPNQTTVIANQFSPANPCSFTPRSPEPVIYPPNANPLISYNQYGLPNPPQPAVPHGNRMGNTYVNTFIVQNNMSTNMNHVQYPQNPQNMYHNQGPPQPSKAFHPFEPLDKGKEYDLTQIGPVDFYSPQYKQPIPPPVLSPPHYGNRGGYGVNSSLSARDRQVHRSSWSPPDAVKSPEDVFKQPSLNSRDPRIRTMEMKEQSERRDPRIRFREMTEQNGRRDPRPRVREMRIHNSRRDARKSPPRYSPPNMENSDKQDTFVSPLGSLYVAAENKTGMGYGIQNFRIPKRASKPMGMEREFTESPPICSPQTVSSSSDVFPTQSSVVVLSDTDESNDINAKETPSTTTEEKKDRSDTVASPSDQSMLSNFLSGLIQGTNKRELLDVILTALTGNISEQQKTKFKRIQKIVDSDTEEEEEETEVIAKTKGKQTTGEESTDSDVKGKATIKDDDDEEYEEFDDTDADDKKTGEVRSTKNTKSAKGRRSSKRQTKNKKLKKKITANRKSTQATSKEDKTTKEDKLTKKQKEKDEEEGVIETVSERIKNRRRNIKGSDAPKPRRCELDMLHDDIKEMFIRDGVLTATGKRMCCILKDDPQSVLQDDGNTNTKLLRSRSGLADNSAPSVPDSPKRRARNCNPKVVIEKTDFSKFMGPNTQYDTDSESEASEASSRASSRSKTRSETDNTKKNTTEENNFALPSTRGSRTKRITGRPNYVEQSDEDTPPSSSSDLEDKRKTDETPSFTQTEAEENDNASAAIKKTPAKRKKRGQNWASGVITKKARKKAATPTPSFEDDARTTYTSDTEEESGSRVVDSEIQIELLKPDTSYYFDPQEKPACRLCSFKGKMITQHYRTQHPDCEVLISRISPENAKGAIAESIEGGFEDVTIEETKEGKNKRKKFTFQCRFCNIFFKNENSDSFFDHLTSHTGEYRFVCGFCTFRTANSKSLRSHVHSNHSSIVDQLQLGPIRPVYPTPPSYHMVFGYICGECYFVQLNRLAIENHWKTYHSDDTPRIHKINMSMVVTKPEQVTEATKQDVQTNEEPVATETKEPEQPPAMPVVKQEIMEQTAIDKKIVKKEDPTVFKYNSDTMQESMKLEEQKQEKMKRLTQTIQPKNPGFNLLDIIKDRLESKIVAETPVENNTEDDVNDDDDDDQQPLIENIFESEPIVDDPVDIPATIPDDPSELQPSGAEKSLANKTKPFMNNLIERLTDKLNIDPLQPPPLIPLYEFNTGDAVEDDIMCRSEVGPVAATRKNDYILYVCYMESCIFSSKDQSEFEMHCTNVHKDKLWDGFCKICQKSMSDKSAEVVDAFHHLTSMHMPINIKSEKIEEDVNEDKKETEDKKESKDKKEFEDKKKIKIKKESEEQKDPEGKIKPPMIRMRRLSGDKLSETRSETEAPRNEMADPATSKAPEKSQAEVASEDTHNFPFHIINVTTLTPEEEERTFSAAKIQETTSASSPSSGILRSIIGSVVVTTAAAGAAITAVSSPLKISLPVISYPLVLSTLSPVKVSSAPLAASTPTNVPAKPLDQTSAPPPAVSPAATTSPATKKVILTDTPMKGNELTEPRKTPEALKVLLSRTKIVNLYKCPEKQCIFSTERKISFNEHLKSHPTLFNVQIPCLYCNFKTRFDYITIHYDIRHGQCPFLCPYCFYRGMKQSYVEIHQELEHHGSPRNVFVAPLNKDAKLSTAQITPIPLKAAIPSYTCGTQVLPEIKSIIQPYKCGCTGCKETYLFLHDFRQHLWSVHGGKNLMCHYCEHPPLNMTNIFQHLQTHNLHQFHCRHCGVGGKSVDEIHKHLAVVHFGLSPAILERRFLFDYSSDQSSNNLNLQEDELYNRLKLIVTEHPSYVTPSALVKVVPVPEKVLKRTNVLVKSIEMRTESKPGGDDIDGGDTAVPKRLKLDGDMKQPIILNNYLSTNLKNIGILQIPDVLSKPSDPNDPPQPSTSKTNVTVIKPENTPVPPTKNVDLLQIDPLQIDPLQIDPLQMDPLHIDPTSEDQNSSLAEEKLCFGDFSDFTSEEDSLSGDIVTKKMNLKGKELFQCSICKLGHVNGQLFRAHVIKCVDSNKLGDSPRPFKCTHCPKSFKASSGLLDHIRLHGTQRFSCSLCDFKHQHQLYIRSHMKTKHKITSIMIVPVDPNKHHCDLDDFVVRPKIGRQKSYETGNNKDSGATDEGATKGNFKLVYHPNEINQLPLPAIFTQELKCAICNFMTKVRANLIRHFQFHNTGQEVLVPTAAPVNPVPCLDKKEMMFDKMTNLALSSFNDTARLAAKVQKNETEDVLTEEEKSQLPSLVPINKTYVCGTENCDYLCLEETMFRYHLAALHSNESFYKCVHCQELFSTEKGTINIEQIIKHLRLHGPNLYKCKYCKFMHRTKHTVERHVNEKHSELPPVVITIRKMSEVIEQEQQQQQQQQQQPDQKEDAKAARPWRCGMCKYRCTTRKEAETHVMNKHEIDAQHKCTLCTFRSNDNADFVTHFEKDHTGHSVDVIDLYYEVEQSSAGKSVVDNANCDTKPIWQRDNKNKFRHIRGIPLDQTNKSLKKSPLKVLNVSENLDKSIEAVVSGSGDSESDTIKSPPTKKQKLSKERKVDTKTEQQQQQQQQQKEDVEDDVIEIIDDDLVMNAKKVLILKDEQNDDALKSPKVAEEKETIVENEKKRLTMEEIQTLSLHELLHSDIGGTYGPYGKPFNKNFVCPQCATFKTKKSEDMITHLYKELEYHRFVCTNCGTTGPNYNFLAKHSAKRHVDIPLAILPMSPISQIEDWVAKVIAVQKRIITETDTTATTSKSSAPAKNVTNTSSKTTSIKSKESSSRIPDNSQNEISIHSLLDSSTPVDENATNKLKKCPYCNYTSKSNGDLKKHEKRHWAQKPLKCGHCDMKAVTSYEITLHSRKAHPNVEVVVVSVPTPSKPTIKPISRQRKIFKNNNDTSVSNSDDSNSATNEITPVVNLEIVPEDPFAFKEQEEEVENDIVYQCNYCPKRCPNELDIKSHWETTHKVRHYEFKYKRIMRSQLPKRGRVNYKCSYCVFIGNYEKIRQHFKTAHIGSNFIVHRFQCGHCHQYMKDQDRFRSHHKQEHCGLEPICLDIEPLPVEQNVAKDFNCEYCDASFDTRQEITDHHNSLHSHLQLNLPPALLPQIIPHKNEDKKFMCFQCRHTSNSRPAIMDHFRSHAKPYKCIHCPARFSHCWHAKNHHNKEHSGLEYRSILDSQAMKLNEMLKKNLLVLSDSGNYELVINESKRSKSGASNAEGVSKRVTARKSTAPLIRKFKATAKKSTSKAFVSKTALKEFSYYGNKPDIEGIETLKTHLTLMNKSIPVNVSQLDDYLDMFPTVAVVDCVKHNLNL